jgi:4-hydroxybenzoate polyprenyltransferase
MFALLIVLFLLSLLNHIVFFSVVLWMILGYIYNTASRFILFGDSTVLAITHYTLPCLASSLILGLNPQLTLKLCLFMFSTFWFLMHSKNLKDTEADSKRGYATLTARFAHGKGISILLISVGFAMMFSSFFLFDLSNRIFPIFFILGVLQIWAVILVLHNKGSLAVRLIRLLMMFFLLGIIIDKSAQLKLSVIPVCLFSVYLLLLLTNSIAIEKYIPEAAG